MTRDARRNSGTREIQAAAARAVAYGSLSKLLLPPDPEASDAIRSGRLGEELCAAAETLAGLGAERARQIAAFARGTPDPEARYYETFDHALVAEHPPFETEYASSGTFQRTADLGDVAGFYAAWGLKATGVPERPDHLGTEAEFLCQIALREAAAREGGRDEQVDLCERTTDRFLREHLGGFAPFYAKRFARRASDPLYVEAVGALADLVTWDAGRRGVVPEARHARLAVVLSEDED